MALANVPSGKDLPNDINVIIEIPADSDPVKYEVDSVRDLTPSLLDQIAHFFEHYKDLEPGKWVRIDGWVGVEEAKAEIVSSIERFQEAPDKPAF